MSNRIEGERVFCYQCENEWDRAHGGLQCPRCESEFVEILEPGSRPPADDPPSVAPSPGLQSSNLSPLHEHNPWGGAPDPDEDDITTFEFNNRSGGRGTFTIQTRTFAFGGANRNTASHDPAAENLARNFNDMFGNIMGNQHRSRTSTHVYGGTFNFGGRGGATFHREESLPTPFGNPQDLFSMIFQTTNSAQTRNQNENGPTPLNPFDFIQAIFNPGNARSGDMVFSQEAFDQVMSQLMEQHNQNGAPPASEDIINSIPRKKIEKSMLGSDGKAECSICMDGVEIGTEVATLPCTHWFHFDCIESWLKEHDTCPHCRKPVTPEDQRNQSNRRRRSSRRSSSIASPMPGAMPSFWQGDQATSTSIPDSPAGLRQARDRYYGRRDSDSTRPRSERHNSERSSRARDDTGGGVGGWIRSHMPFS